MLTIEEAGELFAEHTGRRITRSSFRHVLMAGAESRLEIYWRNSEQRFSRLFGFAGEVVGSSEVIREMQVPPFALGQLESRPAIGITLFLPTDEDWARLEELNSLDEDGDPGGFRALDDGEAWVTLESLLVPEQEIRELALNVVTRRGLETSIASEKYAHRASKSSSDQWSVKKPERFRGYSLPLYNSIVAAYRAGQSPPTAHNILQAWREKLPAEVVEVMSDGLKYYNNDGRVVLANVRAIKVAIKRLVDR